MLHIFVTHFNNNYRYRYRYVHHSSECIIFWVLWVGKDATLYFTFARFAALATQCGWTL